MKRYALALCLLTVLSASALATDAPADGARPLTIVPIGIGMDAKTDDVASTISPFPRTCVSTARWP